MFQKSRILSVAALLLMTFIFASGCKKKTPIAKEGEKCGKDIKCVKGTKCYYGVCEDLSGNNPDCQFLGKASKAIMESNPKELLKGKNFDYDIDTITAIPSAAATIYKAFGNGLSKTQCKRITQCELPKLGVGYSWYWTRSVFNETKKAPANAKKLSADAVEIISVSAEQASMGEDPKMFPPIKIKQMQQHRIGCRAKVKVRVKEEFAGFVTFHFWKNKNCKFVEAEKGVKDSKAGFKCDGVEKLSHPYYTYTTYLYPFKSNQLAKDKKSKEKVTYLTGNPGTYLIDVWAYNPIDENKFGEHKQFDSEEVMKKYPDLIYCPKYRTDPFNNGCGCIGFAKNKVTVTVDPDPFYLPLDEDKCAKMAPQKTESK
ncbi:MAG: hypothetical protein JXR95_05870 [Deltaproteobacteria bacterium]|nr:hypothetical protein [Deltaproteobacteria bacterium]